jgi:hypothetical protein
MNATIRLICHMANRTQPPRLLPLFEGIGRDVVVRARAGSSQSMSERLRHRFPPKAAALLKQRFSPLRGDQFNRLISEEHQFADGTVLLRNQDLGPSLEGVLDVLLRGDRSPDRFCDGGGVLPGD